METYEIDADQGKVPTPQRSDDSIQVASGMEFQFQDNNAYGMELEGVAHRAYENILEDL